MLGIYHMVPLDSQDKLDMPMCHSLETTKDVLGNVYASYSIPSFSFSVGYCTWKSRLLAHLEDYALVGRGGDSNQGHFSER